MRQAISAMVSAPAVWSLVWPMILIVASYVAWQKWGRERISDEISAIDVNKVHINEAPRPIRDGVVETVYRDTDMQRWSMIDRGVTARIASAFAMHPWVREVRNVRKRPNGHLDVYVDYRIPVAMVKVQLSPKDETDYFFPIDGEGIVLPEVDFQSVQTNQFIHIIVEHAFTRRPWGTRFGDPRVEAAASLAAILDQSRERLQLKSIACFDDPRSQDVPQLHLRFEDGSQVLWGSPPGREFAKEATAAAKLDALDTGRGRVDGADLRRSQRIASRGF